MGVFINYYILFFILFFVFINNHCQLSVFKYYCWHNMGLRIVFCICSLISCSVGLGMQQLLQKFKFQLSMFDGYVGLDSCAL